MGRMRKVFVGGYYLSSVFTFAAGFQSRFGSVSALRSKSSVAAASSGKSSPVVSATTPDVLAADLAEGAESLFARSPLTYSQPLSALVGKPVYLKMDALQASGSFKVSS